MLRTQTHLWRLSLLTGLGLLPSACGGDAVEDALGDAAQEAGNTGGDFPEGAAGGAMTVSAIGGTGGMAHWSPPELANGCDSPVERTVAGVPSGLVVCSSGVVHRPEPLQCPNTLAGRTNQIPSAGCSPRSTPDAGVDPEVCPELDQWRACNSDADCTAEPFGHCVQGNGQIENYLCVYGCESDSDCDADEACVCGENIGQCVAADCRQESDCGDNSLCGYWPGADHGCGAAPSLLTCQTPNDACRVDGDCRTSGESGWGGRCITSNRAPFCDDNLIACGRPFLVEGCARLAEVVESSEFQCDHVAKPSMGELTGSQRAELAEAWTQIGLMEHASVAAFARFSLQLLQLGAPARMLRDCQQAMADETEHAHLAFSLASHYAQRNVGPGPLPVDGALAENDLASVVQLVIREGCLGETVAALEAAEALSYCQDPAVRAVLQTISRDELRHSELAWRFVGWALRKQSSLVPMAARIFAEMKAPPGEVLPSTQTDPFDTLVHGVVSRKLRAEVRSNAYRDVVGPCAQALLAAARTPPPEAAETGAVEIYPGV